MPKLMNVRKREHVPLFDTLGRMATVRIVIGPWGKRADIGWRVIERGRGIPHITWLTEYPRDLVLREVRQTIRGYQKRGHPVLLTIKKRNGKVSARRRYGWRRRR